MLGQRGPDLDSDGVVSTLEGDVLDVDALNVVVNTLRGRAH